MSNVPAHPELSKGKQRVDFARRVVIVLACLAVVTGYALQLFAIEQIRATQQNGSPTQKKLARTLEAVQSLAETIADCVTPKGDCYERGQAATATAVNQLIVTMVCIDAPGQQTYADVKACLALANRGKP